MADNRWTKLFSDARIEAYEKPKEHNTETRNRMNIFALLSFLSFLLFFQTGVFVLYKDKNNTLHRIFALLSFLFALYAFSYFLFFKAETQEEVYLYDRIAALGWVFFPVVAVWFNIRLTGNNSKVIRYILYLYLIPIACYAYFVAIADLESVKLFYFSHGNWYYTPYDQTLSYMLFVTYLIVSVLVVYFVLIGWYYAAHNNRSKIQAMIMLWGISLFFLLSFFSNLIFPLFQSELLPAMAPINALILIGSGAYTLALQPGTRISPDMINNLVKLHVREFVFLLDKDAQVYSANNHVLSQLKYNLYDIQRIAPSVIFSDYDKVMQIIDRMNEKVNSSQILVNLHGRDRSVIPVLLSVIKVWDEYNRHLGYVLVCIDYRQKLKLKVEVEERLRTEKNLYQIRKELEMLVKRRTYELQDANLKLQQEVVERRRVEQQIKSDLNEKIKLVQEVHHRVKNNIQMIISLVNMLCSHPKIDSSTSDRLRELAEKVRYISRIHEDFYSSPNLSRIAFASYLKKSIGELYSNYGKGLDITFKLNIANEYLEINQAIPLGIIFNELLINAMSYAFPNANGAENTCMINVEFFRKEGRFQLLVKDNGVGLPQELRQLRSGKTGLKLIQILTREHLRGNLESNVLEGTTFTITFDENLNL